MSNSELGASGARQGGVSLVEIMIGTTLSLVLVSGFIQLFIGSKQTYRVHESMSRLQENGRFAIDFLTRDIRMADFWGCLRNGLGNVTNNLNPLGTGYDPALHSFASGLTGSNGAAGSNAALDSPDTIVMSGAFGPARYVQPPYGPQPSANVLTVPSNGLSQGDIVVVADCGQGDIFQISNANPDTSGTVVHNTGTATQPGNYNPSTCTGGNNHCLSKVYAGDAQIFTVATTTYSVQTGAGGRPALFRNNAELVEGVENMQILYGEDSDGDGTPNYFVPAGSVGLDMGNVVSVRVSLLMATVEDNVASESLSFTYNGATTTPADRRLRVVLNSSVAVRNRLN